MVKKVVFLGTGGTIAGTAHLSGDNIGYQAAQVGVAQLLSQMGSVLHLVPVDSLESEQVAQVDSKDMDWAVWQQLASRVLHHLRRAEVQAVVITHGTDTLEETAYFLSRVLPAALLAEKPVVLTCAMRPASADFPDGPQNLRDALAVATAQGARGVLVVCAGEVHLGTHLQKIHPYRLNPFCSGEQGAVGYVEEQRVRWAAPVPDMGGAIGLSLISATRFRPVASGRSGDKYGGRGGRYGARAVRACGRRRCSRAGPGGGGYRQWVG